MISHILSPRRKQPAQLAWDRKLSTWTAILMDVHALGSLWNDQRVGKSDRHELFYPNGGQWLPNRWHAGVRWD